MARRMYSNPIFYKQVPSGDERTIEDVILETLGKPKVRSGYLDQGDLCDMYLLVFDAWDDLYSYGLSTIIAIPNDDNKILFFKANKVLNLTDKIFYLEPATVPKNEMVEDFGYRFTLQKVASSQPYQIDYT